MAISQLQRILENSQIEVCNHCIERYIERNSFSVFNSYCALVDELEISEELLESLRVEIAHDVSKGKIVGILPGGAVEVQYKRHFYLVKFEDDKVYVVTWATIFIETGKEPSDFARNAYTNGVEKTSTIWIATINM